MRFPIKNIFLGALNHERRTPIYIFLKEQYAHPNWVKQTKQEILNDPGQDNPDRPTSGKWYWIATNTQHFVNSKGQSESSTVRICYILVPSDN